MIPLCLSVVILNVIILSVVARSKESKLSKVCLSFRQCRIELDEAE
jgi:hypothetical protein